MADCGPDTWAQRDDQTSPQTVFSFRFHGFPLGWYKGLYQLLYGRFTALSLPDRRVEPLLPQIFTLDGAFAPIYCPEGCWRLPLRSTCRKRTVWLHERPTSLRSNGSTCLAYDRDNSDRGSHHCQMGRFPSAMSKECQDLLEHCRLLPCCLPYSKVWRTESTEVPLEAEPEEEKGAGTPIEGVQKERRDGK